MINYELEEVAAGVLRRRLRVRLRFGLSPLAVSAVSPLAVGLAVAFDFAVLLSFAVSEVSLLF